ncbi:hypothetical protein [Roseinatronobacter sp. NSM]|uniref:hypothetical protein n=1 Tax=Roseinatronobacter sp. NSM TaxID=3457785 RepID=UPI0040364FD2
MKQLLPTLTLLATAAFVLSPYVTDPFSGFDPQRFPVPQLDPPVQPAGYAFAIWGIIYLWLAVFAVMGVYARRQDAGWHRVQAPMILSLGPGALWLWIAGFSPIGATVLIFWMLFFAVQALLRAPSQDRWVLQAPIGLYAGWLTAAAHVSLGVSLGGYGLASPLWAAIIALAGATALAVWVLARRPDSPDYSVAVIWALIGVLVANLGGAPVILAVTAAALLVVVGAAIRNLWAGHTKAAL